MWKTTTVRPAALLDTDDLATSRPRKGRALGDPGLDWLGRDLASGAGIWLLIIRFFPHSSLGLG